MKQVILMSIRPEWVAKILNGEKTVEIRKTALHEGDEVHIYCTKGRPWLYFCAFGLGKYQIETAPYHFGDEENGKVVAKFIVGKVEKISYLVLEDNYEEVDGESVLLERGGKGYFVCENDLKPMCISYEELLKYGKEKPVYAHEITKLEIFDKPRELGEYKKLVEDYSLGATGGFAKLVSITHAPQSWMYCEVEDGTTDMEAISDTNKLADNLKTMERLKKESEEK